MIGFVVVVRMFLLILSVETGTGETLFTVNPASVNTTVNSTVTFTCIATADLLTFIVDGMQVEHQDIQNRGFTESVVASGGRKIGVLTAIAYNTNNGSNISCTAILFVNPIQTSNSITASLLIQGPLAGVGDLTATPLTSTSVQLTWTPPYTLDNVPITGYYIDIINTTVNDTSVYLLSPPNPDPCTPVNVSVTAVNGVGMGWKSYIVVFYFQRVSLKNISVNLSSVVEGGSHISLSSYISVTNICEGEYPTTANIYINDNNGVARETHALSLLAAQNLPNQQVLLGNVTIPYIYESVTVNVTLSNLAGLFPHPYTGYHFHHLIPVQNISAARISCNLVNISWVMSETLFGNFHYKLQIYQDDSLVTAESLRETNYQFNNEFLFHHNFTYIVTVVNELNHTTSASYTFIHNIRVPESVKEFIVQENGEYLNLNVLVLPECSQEAPFDIIFHGSCGSNIIAQSYSVPGEGRKVLFKNIPRHQLLCTINATVSNNITRQSDPLILINEGTFDVRFIKVLQGEHTICVSCQLAFSFSEHCYIEVKDALSLTRVWDRTLTSEGNFSTEQGCTNNLPAGNYTVYAYDVNSDGQPILIQPLHVNIVEIEAANITGSSSLSTGVIIVIVCTSACISPICAVFVCGFLWIHIKELRQKYKKRSKRHFHNFNLITTYSVPRLENESFNNKEDKIVIERISEYSNEPHIYFSQEVSENIYITPAEEDFHGPSTNPEYVTGSHRSDERLDKSLQVARLRRSKSI